MKSGERGGGDESYFWLREPSLDLIPSSAVKLTDMLVFLVDINQIVAPIPLEQLLLGFAFFLATQIRDAVGEGILQAKAMLL